MRDGGWGSLQGLSNTFTIFAPASKHMVTSVATTWGFVFAAISGTLSQPIFGLTTTTSPFLTNCFIPPSSSTAFLVIAAGLSPFTTVMSHAVLTALRLRGSSVVPAWRSERFAFPADAARNTTAAPNRRRKPFLLREASSHERWAPPAGDIGFWLNGSKFFIE